MKEDSKISEIPKIDSTEETTKEETSKKFDEQMSDTFQTVTTKLKEVVNIDLFLPDIHEWILEKLKQGPTLIIGENIGNFSGEVSKYVPSVIARETISTYVSPKIEVKDEAMLSKIDLKAFDIAKLKTQQGPFLNIIIIFSLKKLEKTAQYELLKECKRMLSREGQLILVGEFYPKSILLYPVTLTKEGVKIFKSKILKKKVTKPITNFDKMANDLELKFFDIKHDAGGRIRTYVLTKRWGALLT
ncbi:MAG: hypothetical protein E3J43_00580 [Candidatus Heimdallarchaeota archaeon]|nr:MAG: hypothetical protein E3J43_00580 [Candidatus Heimdallarchaeota archaeon]